MAKMHRVCADLAQQVLVHLQDLTASINRAENMAAGEERENEEMRLPSKVVAVSESLKKLRERVETLHDYVWQKKQEREEGKRALEREQKMIERKAQLAALFLLALEGDAKAREEITRYLDRSVQ